MKSLILLLILIFTACSSMPRTKWTDKNMRVMIDPDSIAADHYVKIQSALVQSDKFVVVDRATGFNAIMTEQNRLHRGQADRYSDQEKWAQWGKMYGVGAIVVAHAQCTQKQTSILLGFGEGNAKMYCHQYLALIDANTGVIMAVGEDHESGESIQDGRFLAPEWTGAIANLIDHYPKTFTSDSNKPVLVQYQAESKEEALRQKELVARTPSSLGGK